MRSAYPESHTSGDLRFERWDASRHTDGLAELCADPVVMVGYDEARSYAHSCEPTNELPLNMLNVS